MIPAILLFAAVILYRIVLGVFGNGDSWMPNFAPVAAIALCGPLIFPRRIAIVLPLAILLASDVVLNWHCGVALASLEMVARYAALLALAIAGSYLSGRRRMGEFLLASAIGSTLFYLVTNSASWLTAPEYAKTAAGWWQALTVGVPGYPPTWIFFRNSLVSDVTFTLLFVACLAWGGRCATRSANDLDLHNPERTPPFMKTWFVILLAAVGAALTPARAQMVVGTGPDSSRLVIEAAAFGSPLIYEFRYTYDPLSPLTTTDMLVAVDAATADVTFELLYGGTFLNGVTYVPLTLTLSNSVTPPDYSPFWAQWVSGGESGDPLAPMPDNTWSAGFGPGNRIIEPGSWDGFIFNGAYEPSPPYGLVSLPPSVSPIPEPSGALLLTLSVAVVLVWRRRRNVGVQPSGYLESAR